MYLTDISVLSVFCLLISFRVPTSNAFANNLIRDHCDRKIEPGVNMMGKALVIDSDNKYTIKVMRDNDIIVNKSSYQPSNVFTITVEPKIYQMTVEVRGNAIFEAGGCNGTRVTTNGAKLRVLSPIETSNITLICAWSKGYASGVHITSPFLLFSDLASQYGLEF